MVPRLKEEQTFEIVSLNLIHKSKKKEKESNLKNCPPPQAAGKKPRRLAGKKFPPLEPLHFLPARRKRNLVIHI
jgi:hypothetical protein